MVASVSVQGLAIGTQAYLDSQGAAYSAAVKILGKRPSMLLGENPQLSKFTLLEGFPELTGQEIRDLMALAQQPPMPTSTGTAAISNWDVDALVQKLQQIMQAAAGIQGQDKKLKALIGEVVLAYNSDPNFQQFFDSLVYLLQQEPTSGVSLFGLFLAGLVDLCGTACPEGTGTLLELFRVVYQILFPSGGTDTSSITATQAANVLIATFTMLMGDPVYSSEVGQLLTSLTSLSSLVQNPHWQLAGIVGAVFTAQAFLNEIIKVDPFRGPDALFRQFTVSLTTAINRYMQDQGIQSDITKSWAHWILDYLRALSDPKLRQYQNHYANMAASLITYVNLATSSTGPWKIVAAPAAQCMSSQCPVGGNFVHVLAQKEFMLQDGSTKTVVGLFHTEAKLAQSDLDILEKDITILNERLDRFFHGLLAELARAGIQAYEAKQRAAIFITALSIDSNQTALDLKSRLEGLGLEVPVYVVYVDQSGIVRGYCVGPGCSQEVLNQTARDTFGVDLNREAPPTSLASGEEPIVISPVCDSEGVCIQ